MKHGISEIPKKLPNKLLSMPQGANVDYFTFIQIEQKKTTLTAVIDHEPLVENAIAIAIIRERSI